ncbi:MFS transporter [Salinimonas marina]|uniref:MFS transporter n=1 Tax=Salinimonas marina TaxID=2785918 RepID=A0A7S9HD32_9ALTE|nr:MFS transporter [Salinimonas marina]
MSAYYFFSCAIYGAMLPYWVLWMRDQGYSTVQIGGVTSAQILMTVAGTYFFGYLSDKTGKPLMLVRTGVMIALAIFAAVFWVAENYLGVVMVLAGSSFFWQGINAQFEVITLRHLGRFKDNYSLVRLVGSVGFVLSVWATGHLLEIIDIGYLPVLLLGLMMLLLITAWINYGGHIQPGHDASLTIRGHLKQPVVLVTIAIFFLSNLSHGSYYGFFSLFLEERGYSQGQIGNLWSVAVVFELMMFAVMPMMLRYISYTRILMISLTLTVVRWAVMASEPSTWWALAFIQLLHGFTFSWVHSVGILMFKQLFPDALEGRGQALFAGGCAAAGQAVGIAGAGYLWNWGAGLTFAISAACALVALALTLLLTPLSPQPAKHSVPG